MGINVSIDLETFDTSPSAVVTAIGLAAFDMETGQILRTLYVMPDLDTQVAMDRTISPRTVLWWMQQSQAAREALTEGQPYIEVAETLGHVRDFFQADPLEGVWGNGSDFDNAILGSLFKSANMPQPWSYGRNMCMRTLKKFRLPKEYVAPARKGVHHNALDDAVYQAEVIAAHVKALNLTL